MSSFKVVNNEVTQETELYHKKSFIASWNTPKTAAEAEPVVLGMLEQAYIWGQTHRSEEINAALKKLGVL